MASIDLATAQATPLMGRPESWDFNGGKPIGDVSDAILKQARSFFANRIERPNERTKEQVRCIDMVLADREAHSPQTTLTL